MMKDAVIHSCLPLWACLASLLAVPGILIFRKERFLREGITFASGLVKFSLVVFMVPRVLSGKTIEYTLVKGIAGINVPLQFRVDGLGILFAVVASSLWLLTSLYSVGYVRALKEHSQTRYFVFFAISLSATLGVAFAGNLLTLYLFYEMLSLATWPLVTHHQDKEARSAGRTYLTHLLGTSVGFALPALIFCYAKTGGNMSFADGGFLTADIGSGAGIILMLMFAFGFSKAGMMPFHSWLPGAMVAPTPVSALLHAVAVVKVGVFCILRVVTGVFGIDLLDRLGIGTVLAWVASFTVIVSSLIALTQDNLKRRLAFSTIGQLSYIIVGASVFSNLALRGAMLHIATHAVAKITLFMCAGAIFVATGKKQISQMVGLGRKMPITFAAFFIASLSVIGLPPTAGFISKWYLVLGAMDAGQIALVVVLIISSILNIAYLLPIAWNAFYPAPNGMETDSGIAEAPWACVAPLVITSALCLLLFFWNGWLIKLTDMMLLTR